MATSTIRESATLTGTGTSGNMLITLITPGVGSSGVYPAEVLEAAATNKVFPAGTPMFADHPGETEMYDRPERSIKDLAAVTVEDARWDGGELVAEAKPFGPWREVLHEMKDAIGCSIRAGATVSESADPATGKPIIESIDQAISVDFVTKAGRGGRIREVYESARERSPLIVTEATVVEASNQQRSEELRQLVRDAHATGSGQYAYVIDYDETARTVTFEVENGGNSGTYTQTYTVTNDVATALDGTPVEVQRVVTYVPVTESVPSRPAGQSTATESLKEDTMASIQIEETRLRQLETDAGRATALESERDTLTRERDEARTAVTEAHRETDRERAARIIAEADHDFNALEARGLLADLPLGEDGRLDQAAFTTAVTEAAAAAQEAAGTGRVRGLGGDTQFTGGDTAVSESAIDAAVGGAFGRTVKEA
ncbi:hypothetical protein SAMN05216184_104108 [Georgenia satyanarayanai]|uniref:Uncharacterized protein n=1 Tax=Georgenia satyanarayanai TaxID=860221 RepID=A0A2Y9A7H2_9MICO|nr:hypothetical protein [Georgenia satyanarayanai]PYG00169.1 hypothetical protein A8987_104108 [Georgenia satyanarayanai]SSA40394.1 hypothetical protein SAMN05216184_104108 [Georgenia satyanarayanai]